MDCGRFLEGKFKKENLRNVAVSLDLLPGSGKNHREQTVCSPRRADSRFERMLDSKILDSKS